MVGGGGGVVSGMMILGVESSVDSSSSRWKLICCWKDVIVTGEGAFGLWGWLDNLLRFGWCCWSRWLYSVAAVAAWTGWIDASVVSSSMCRDSSMIVSPSSSWYSFCAASNCNENFLFLGMEDDCCARDSEHSIVRSRLLFGNQFVPTVDCALGFVLWFLLWGWGGTGGTFSRRRYVEQQHPKSWYRVCDSLTTLNK